MTQVIVVGGGAAGMLAAYGAARQGHPVLLFEKNEKLGKKLYITGKGRCNITNAADLETILAHVVSNPRFLYSALYGFSNEDMIRLLNEAGLETKTERGMRVFPVSDKSSDVIRTLQELLEKNRVRIYLNKKVDSLILEPDEQGNPVCKGVVTEDGRKHQAAVTIVATGGISYPSTGSTGDGYRFAQEAGHQITDLSPALVPFTTKEDWVSKLQGLSLRNISVTITSGKRKLYSEFGEMLFTHFGVSGPAVLSGSSVCARHLRKGDLTLHIDLKPALSKEQLDARLLREFREARNKQIGNVLGCMYPSSLVPVILQLSEIPSDKVIHDVTREDRNRLISQTKDLQVTLNGLRGYKEAIITQGGIKVKEINPSTMESKLVKGLRFAGEVLDVDAFTGGYNLQIAWSTGFAAGTVDLP